MTDEKIKEGDEMSPEMKAKIDALFVAMDALAAQFTSELASALRKNADNASDAHRFCVERDEALRALSDATDEAHRMETALKETCVEMAERDDYVEQLAGALRHARSVLAFLVAEETRDGKRIVGYSHRAAAIEAIDAALAKNPNGAQPATSATLPLAGTVPSRADGPTLPLHEIGQAPACEWTGGGEDGPWVSGCNAQEWWSEEGLDAPSDWMGFCPFCGKRAVFGVDNAPKAE